MARKQKLHNKPKKLASAQKDLTGFPLLQVRDDVVFKSPLLQMTHLSKLLVGPADDWLQAK